MIVSLLNYLRCALANILLGRGLDAWGRIYDSKVLNINWHTPSEPEIEFAVKLFRSQCEGAVTALAALTTDTTEVKRDGTGKEWSDEVVRNLVLLRLATSGISVLFDPQYVPEGDSTQQSSTDDNGEDDAAEGAVEIDDSQTAHRYPAGYYFKDKKNDPIYKELHSLRDRIGRTLHHVHEFLTTKQEDDVACFNALYTVSTSHQVRHKHSEQYTGISSLVC